MQIPLLILSFFCLVVLYLLTFVFSSVRLCKLPQFNVDSKISK
jgi:hypothetical protein